MGAFMDRLFGAFTKTGRPPKEPKQETQKYIQYRSRFGGDKNKPLPKPTYENLRRFSYHPIARRGINEIKNQVVNMDWEIRAKKGFSSSDPTTKQHIEQATRIFERPSNTEDFHLFTEMFIEDLLTVGYGAFERRLSPDTDRPARLFIVDGATIEPLPMWTGNPKEKRWAQATGDRNKPLLLSDSEIVVARPNPNTSNPFGVSPLEVAFNTINDFIASHGFANRKASNQTPEYLINLGEGVSTGEVDGFRFWWENEIEGQGRSPVIGGKKGAEVLRLFGGVNELNIPHQEFLIRMVSWAFDLSPVKYGMLNDVNRSTAETQTSSDEYRAIKPWAKLISRTFTTEVLTKLLGFTDVEFVFVDLKKEDETKQAAVHKTYLDGDVFTPDEVRADLGMDPLPDGRGALTRTERNIQLAQARGTAVNTDNPAGGPGAKRPDKGDENVQ